MPRAHGVMSAHLHVRDGANIATSLLPFLCVCLLQRACA